LIAVDTNILVYAHRKDSAWHAAAEACVRELWTADRDFSRFGGLRTRNPLS